MHTNGFSRFAEAAAVVALLGASFGAPSVCFGSSRAANMSGGVAGGSAGGILMGCTGESLAAGCGAPSSVFAVAFGAAGTAGIGVVAAVVIAAGVVSGPVIRQTIG
jgi:hypothetical protein